MSPADSSRSETQTAILWERVLSERTAQVDALITTAAHEILDSQIKIPFAVAAVGGYGRRELFPYSDVDLLMIVESEEDLVTIKEPFSTFLRLLWDKGLRISQSARTIAECTKLHDQNIELSISLLDLRYLCGDAGVFAELESRLPQFFQRHGDALIRRLAELTRSRHAKFNETVYHLEPNIKESPGGIRDLHFLSWLNRLMPHNEAVRSAIAELTEARSFLYGLRIYLHRRAGRDNNLLSFELQDEAARDLAGGADSAEWARSYYLHARNAWQAARRALENSELLDPSLLRQLWDRRSRLSTSEYTVSRDRVLLRNPAETTHSAEAVLRLFTFVGRHGVRLAWDTQRRLRAYLPVLAERFAKEPAPWESWHALFSQPHAGIALHEMQETGVLAAALPEWLSIDSLVVRDFYHRYTVDEHTLVAVNVIDDLNNGVESTSKRLQQLLKEMDDIAVLRLAIILHDIGKGTNPGEHVVGSLETARRVMSRMGVPPEHRQTIVFLIEHHLDLSLIMNARDVDDPATARYLTSRVGTLERLRYLTLLAYADISAVNPTAMTPWRLEQLWRVYSTGLEQLTRELQTDRIHGIDLLPPEERSPELIQFLEGLPTRYLRTHSLEEIHHHCSLARRYATLGAAVEVTSHKGYYLATILAPDKQGLFANMSGALASFGMNIVKAEAFANAQGMALDQFRFIDPLRSLELNPTEVDRLRRTLERVILGTEDVHLLLKRRRPAPRPSRGARVLPLFRFNNDASEVATLVDFVGEDRPGLLYDLASAFASAGCNIELVLIDTEAHRALDVFYVTRDCRKLDESAQDELRQALIHVAASL